MICNPNFNAIAKVADIHHLSAISEAQRRGLLISDCREIFLQTHFRGGRDYGYRRRKWTR